jgi:dihydrofolate reductase
MANIVYIATSLDGYIARKDGNIDWLMETPNPDNSDYGFSAFMDRIDGIIMGRSTFETVLAFNEWVYAKPVFVLSNTLKEVPSEVKDKAEIIQGDLRDLVASLKTRGMKDLYIDGGKTIQSFLKLDLIDELIITRIPIILGSGIPLFDKLDLEIKFSHRKTEVFGEELVKSIYLRKA